MIALAGLIASPVARAIGIGAVVLGLAFGLYSKIRGDALAACAAGELRVEKAELAAALDTSIRMKDAADAANRDLETLLDKTEMQKNALLKGIADGSLCRFTPDRRLRIEQDLSVGRQ